jgi:putative ABC transport system substrate-binding protein
MKKVGWSSILVATLVLVFGVAADAQQPKKVPRIGVLVPTTPVASSQRIEDFWRGLRELGYADGININIVYRYADGKTDRLPAIAAELVGLKVDIILAANNNVARSVSALTKTTPIVLLSGSDPIVGGLVASLAQPGGNITGLTNLTFDLGPKRLELLKDIVPKLTRIAVLPSPGGIGQDLKELQAVAPALQLQLHIMEVHISDDLESAFTRALSARAGALIVTSDPTGIFLNNAQQIINQAAKNRLPAIPWK